MRFLVAVGVILIASSAVGEVNESELADIGEDTLVMAMDRKQAEDICKGLKAEIKSLKKIKTNATENMKRIIKEKEQKADIYCKPR